MRTDLEREYVKVTYDYALAAASAFSSLDPNFKFVYVSGEGATTSPGFLTPMFGRIKGLTEAAILSLSHSLPSLKPYSVRPAFVDARRQPEIHPYIPQPSLTIRAAGSVLGPLTDTVWRSGASPTKELGEFMLKLAIGDGKPLDGPGVDGEGRTVSNVAFRRMMGI
jgi:hypothetical protein